MGAHADFPFTGRTFRGPAGGFAEAAAIRDGVAAAVGNRDAVDTAAGPGARRVAPVAFPTLNEAPVERPPFGPRVAGFTPRYGAVTWDRPGGPA